MYTAHMSATTKFVFLGLAEELKIYFESQEGSLDTLAMGLDSADDRCIKLLARVGETMFIVQL